MNQSSMNFKHNIHIKKIKVQTQEKIIIVVGSYENNKNKKKKISIVKNEE